MNEITPEKLFASICKVKPVYAEVVGRYYAEGVPLPQDIKTVRLQHAKYIHTICEKGFMWLGGPLNDINSPMSLNVFSVESIERATEIQRNDPLYANGFLYDDRYYEWSIHLPVEKASPSHRQRLEETFREAGVA